MAKRRKVEADGELCSDLLDLAREALGDDQISDVNYWLPTGSTLIDLVINQGLPGGHMVEIFGKPATGKSAIALQIVKQAQLRGGVGVYMDAEGRLSTSLAENVVGVRTDTGWIYRRPMNLEEALDACERFADRAIKSDLPTVIVVDSIAGLVPKTLGYGSDGEPLLGGKRQQGKKAQVLSWFFERGFTKKIHGSNVFFIVLNQVRHSLDFFSYGPPKVTTTGGYAMEFYSSVRLHMQQRSLEKRDSKEGKKIVGQLLKVSVEKNTVGPPFREVEIPFYFDPSQPMLGFDDATSMLGYLINKKVIKSAPAGWYVIGDLKERRAALRKKMDTDPTFAKLIKDLTIETFALEYGDTPPEDDPDTPTDT